MQIDKNELFKTLLNAIVTGYGIELDTKSAAKVLNISSRQLDELRKKSESPAYIEARGNGNSKGIKYTAQAIVEYQLVRAERQVLTNF